MKKNIHPKYKKIVAICSCGNKIITKSTIKSNINLDVCNNCHPFYTGKQRDLIIRGKMNKFKKHFQIPIIK
ncbi:MAG: 50S ribosomal protein L31 [Arsenophonus sp.]|nr:MAG: 50S ribosomal protein L31 [Arsenophonus sp.]